MTRPSSDDDRADRLYRNGTLAEEGFPAAEMSERLQAEPGAFGWLDLTNPVVLYVLFRRKERL